MKLDILAFGVHPDDVELGCGGYLVAEVNNGKKVGIIDLTRGELGTNGTGETRLVESEEAKKVMGVVVRENLKMRDGFFRNDEEHQMKIIKKIRQYQPEIVLCNILRDRHPDHGRAGHLVSEACFLSGLIKIETTDEKGNKQEKWRPKMVWQYIQSYEYKPDFVVDITDVLDKKIEAVLAYKTQFDNGDYNKELINTYINSPDFLEGVRSRARIMGKRIGVRYAEGFISEKSIGIKNMDSIILKTT